MLQKSRGIVLHTIKYGESGLVATMYTELHGRVSFLLQGIHGKKSAVRANLVRQLSLVEMEVDFKPGRELQRVRELKNCAPFVTVPYEIVKSTQAIFIAELLYKVLHEEGSRPELFDFLYHSIEFLDLATEGASNFHLLFLVQLTRYLGFAPTNNYDEEHTVFDLTAGKFLTVPPGHPWFLNAETGKAFSSLLETGYRTIPEFRPEQRIKRILIDALIDYYALHTGHKIVLKSLDILREILH